MICRFFKKKRKKDFRLIPVLSVTDLEDKIFWEIVNARGSHLAQDLRLQNEAKIRAMEISIDFSHQGRQDNFKGLKELGLKNPCEILGRNYTDAYELVDAWLESPGHKKVMLNPKHRYIGVGVHSYTPSVGLLATYVCVIFGR